ncbi:MAG: hypothetical protein H7Y37_10005 [Anaerolineae bacterium]|nr:hypothetical protein [Gloeobacterales cyanobacterium ES-bin-313]
MKSLRNHKGVTLVEILVSASMATITAGALIGVLSQVAQKSSSGNQTTTLANELKPALDLISDEAQGAAKLYTPANLTAISVTGGSNVQPILGFWVPNLTTAVETDYYFRLFYLADAPDSVNYKGPKVLYYSQDSTLTTVAATNPPTPPTNPPASVVGGNVVADYLITQPNPLAATSQVNNFVVDGTNKAGVVYLSASTLNMSGTQSTNSNDRSLTLQTRINARN